MRNIVSTRRHRVRINEIFTINNPRGETGLPGSRDFASSKGKTTIIMARRIYKCLTWNECNQEARKSRVFCNKSPGAGKKCVFSSGTGCGRLKNDFNEKKKTKLQVYFFAGRNCMKLCVRCLRKTSINYLKIIVLDIEKFSIFVK